jgi:hypothetical protein
MATDTRTQAISSKDFPVILNNYCEINVAHHCNLSCRGCTHLSPVLSKEFIDPETLRTDLRTLGKYYHAGMIRLLGGRAAPTPPTFSISSQSHVNRRLRHSRSARGFCATAAS